MKLYILGCGDAFGSGGRNQSGYLVEASDRFFLIDCGPTTLLAMKRAGFDPLRLDAIFLSHLHGDHFGGIPFFLIEYLYQRTRCEPLYIAGPVGTKERVVDLFGLMYGGTTVKELPPVKFSVLEPEKPALVAGIEIMSFRVPHQVREISLALKIGYDGKQILFSGDSAWTDRFVAEAQGVDLFLCECSFYDQGAGNHMRYLTLREHLPRFECKQIVLTHLGDEMLTRRSELKLAVAEDGLVIKI